MTEKVVVAKKYLFIKDKKENLGLILFPYSQKPKNPEILYDGGQHAIFYRNEDQTIILDFINKDARLPLKKRKDIMIGEISEQGKIEHEYKAKVKQVKKIPNIEKHIEKALKEIEKNYKQNMKDNPKSKEQK
jgi:hypothetical protein